MGSKNSNNVSQKKRRGRRRKKVLIIFAVIAAVAGTLFGVTYKVFEADTIEFVVQLIIRMRNLKNIYLAEIM
mgnify:CR=1 FL=1